MLFFQTNSSTINFTPTIAPHVLGISDSPGLDPVSTARVDFEVEYPSEYSTACIESIECHRCDRNDDGCDDNFLDDREANLTAVSPEDIFTCIIEVKLATIFRKRFMFLASNGCTSRLSSTAARLRWPSTWATAPSRTTSP